MSFEVYGWMMTLLLFVGIAVIIKITWMLAYEAGYDKGYGRGYQMRRTVDEQRGQQLKADNEYLMGRVVNLFDRENK